MKIPVEYGGLGLGQHYYNRALVLIGSVNASLGALLSAHQSVGVPEPLVLAGTEEQKRRFLPRCAKGAISAFLLTEPEVGSDPARLQATALPTEDDDGVRPERHEAVDHQRGGRRTARRDGARAEVGRAPRRDQRVRRRGRLPRHHRASPQRVHGVARNRERADLAAERARAAREPDRPRGRRPQDRADHPQRRAVGDPGHLRRGGQVEPEDRTRVVARARAVGPTRRRTRRGRPQDRVHRRDDLRAGGGGRPVGDARRRGPQGHPHRGGARQDVGI